MKALVSRFLNDESGATAIEYGLIASLIAVAIISAAGLLGNNIAASFNSIAGKMKNAT
ncbi:Component of type IV pilus [uncultured Pleomorphomonas sp.]|uniref:Component of type IV pilus n=1 Tax=uncultured Pleomorphomonas sp. TaxID=442121 RepID=A0A212LKY2_9HYPH|nr:Flp family type IVb pilin [uncultured Pleomorphomonas sp.]SCM78202.1 Component of type IV pilus [uncultured Pleomorphomonas sp.]